MVKIFFILFVLFVNIFGDDLLNNKISTFIDRDKYIENKDFIDIIFTPSSAYYINGRIDDVKVIKTLKDNGLLNLFFDKPKEISLQFKTSGSPIFFLKIMGDALRYMGYYRYITTESNLNVSEFTWSISLTSEYATDPLVLQDELLKRGSKIVDITRISQTEWVYSIDMDNAHLDLTKLEVGQGVELKRSLYAHWLDVSDVDSLSIKGSFRNSWYPYITFYDSSMHLLKVIKDDTKKVGLNLEIPPHTTYMKISDLYTLKNIKDPLQITPKSSR
ncbi:MAG: hypothetical protein JXQ66_02960 [Campylobacterales bacterium]|nr:hypothetical protein [Campylobacterales bacterium]